MKNLNLLGKSLSRNEMRSLTGGDDDVLICTSSCIASYITTCEQGGGGSQFCTDRANEYCIPFCNGSGGEGV